MSSVYVPCFLYQDYSGNPQSFLMMWPVKSLNTKIVLAGSKGLLFILGSLNKKQAAEGITIGDDIFKMVKHAIGQKSNMNPKGLEVRTVYFSTDMTGNLSCKRYVWYFYLVFS